MAHTSGSSVSAVAARCGTNRARPGSSLTCHSACGPSPRYGGAGPRITTSGKAKRPQRLRVEVVLDPGPDLFSQGPTSRVSSALVGLTAVFGMGTGVTPPLQGPRTQLYQARLLRAQPLAPALGQPREGRGAERERGDQREGGRPDELLLPLEREPRWVQDQQLERPVEEGDRVRKKPPRLAPRGEPPGDERAGAADGQMPESRNELGL